MICSQRLLKSPMKLWRSTVSKRSAAEPPTIAVIKRLIEYYRTLRSTSRKRYARTATQQLNVRLIGNPV